MLLINIQLVKYVYKITLNRPIRHFIFWKEKKVYIFTVVFTLFDDQTLLYSYKLLWQLTNLLNISRIVTLNNAISKLVWMKAVKKKRPHTYA